MMETNYTAIVNAIVEKVKVDDDSRFYVNDKLFTVSQRTAYQHWSRPMQSFGENTGEDVRKREKLASELTACLYGTYYVSGKADGEWFDEALQPTAEEKNEFMNQLSAANQTVESWDPCWKVVSTDASGTVYVQKNNLYRTLVANEWRPEQTVTGALQPGATVSLLNRKEKRDLQPVFYYVYAQSYMPPGTSLGRFYFNVLPTSIVGFVQILTHVLNKYKIPFLFKCLNHPKLYVRADSAVLYIEKKYFTVTGHLLQDILKHNPMHFKPLVPLFTKAIGPGAAYAEDPGNGKSFGMFWSEMIAEGLVKAYEKNITEAKEILPLVLAEFAKNGVDIEKPYMRSNSQYPYNFSIFN
jgi:HopA1 effector protein family